MVKNNGEKKITHPGERAPEAASVEIIQARKEISSIIKQIIIKNNDIYTDFYAIFYIFYRN